MHKQHAKESIGMIIAKGNSIPSLPSRRRHVHGGMAKAALAIAASALLLLPEPVHSRIRVSASETKAENAADTYSGVVLEKKDLPEAECFASPETKVAWWAVDKDSFSQDGKVQDLIGDNHGTILGGVEAVPGRNEAGALKFRFGSMVLPNEAFVLRSCEPESKAPEEYESTKEGAAAARGDKGWMSPLPKECELTFEAWTQTEEVSGIVPIVDTRGIDGGGYFFYLANGFLGMRVGGEDHITHGYVGDGEWHHIAFSLTLESKGATLHMYVDGNNVAHAHEEEEGEASSSRIDANPSKGSIMMSIGMADWTEANKPTNGTLAVSMPQRGAPPEVCDPKKAPSPKPKQVEGTYAAPAVHRYFQGTLTDIGLYRRALHPDEIKRVAKAKGGACLSKAMCAISVVDMDIDLAVGNSFVNYGGSHSPLASGMYLLQTTQSGPFTINNLSAGWNGVVAGAYQFIPSTGTISVSGWLPASAQPGQCVTITYKIYNILGQLVCQGSSKVCVKVPCPDPCPGLGMYDGANCYVWSVPGNTPFIYGSSGNFYYKKVWHPWGPCPHNAWDNFNNIAHTPFFDTANCYLGTSGAGNPFLYGSPPNYYISAVPGTDPCPYGGTYDSANCYMFSWPGVHPFIYNGNFYYRGDLWHPDAPCPHDAYNNWSGDNANVWYDNANCVVSLHPGGGQVPFIWSNNYYLTPVCDP